MSEIETENNEILSREAISYLFSLELNTHSTFDIKLTLQILTIQKAKQKSPNSPQMYTATLIDTRFNYGGFVIIRNMNEKYKPLKENDIITILSVSPVKTNTNSIRVFVVPKYERSKTKYPLLYPFTTPYKEEKINSFGLIEEEIDEKEESGSSSNQITTTSDAKQIEKKIKENKYTPLKHLTTFSKNFTILIRVTKKSPIKNLSSSGNFKGASWFYFVGIDIENVEIQIMCFNQLVDVFYPQIQENEVYEITDGYIKINDSKHLITNTDYKIVLNENSKISKVIGGELIKPEKIEITTIYEMGFLPNYKSVNALVYVIQSEDKVLKHTKNGDLYMKKLVVGDASGYNICCSLWRELSHLELMKGDIILIKKAKVGEFNNNRNLSTYDDSSIEKNPKEFKEEIEILTKFINEHQNETKALNSPKNPYNFYFYKVDYINDIITNTEKNGKNNTGHGFKVKATITQIMHNEKNIYFGCPNDACKKKLTDLQINNKFCENCRTSFEETACYYNISIRVKDCSFEYWIDIFGKCGEELFGMAPDVYYRALVQKNKIVLKAISMHIEFHEYYLFTKQRSQHYGPNNKKKLYAYKIERVETTQESKKLLEGLKHLLQLK